MTALIAGQQLCNYEMHIMVDMLLLHARLVGGTPIDSSTPIELAFPEGKAVPIQLRQSGADKTRKG